MPFCLPRLAASLLLALALAVSVQAQDQNAEPPLPGWWLAEMTMPDDHRIEAVREVGSRIRMLAFHTDTDADTLLTGWAERMEADGYAIDWSVNPDGPPSFEFEGEAVLNGQAVSTPCHEGCASRIQVDMTLR